MTSAYASTGSSAWIAEELAGVQTLKGEFGVISSGTGIMLPKAPEPPLGVTFRPGSRIVLPVPFGGSRLDLTGYLVAE